MCSELAAACRPAGRGEPVLGGHLARGQGPQARGSCPVRTRIRAFGTTVWIAQLPSCTAGELRFSLDRSEDRGALSTPVRVRSDTDLVRTLGEYQ
jgi:hypothetical protein